MLYCGSHETIGTLFKACFFTLSLLPDDIFSEKLFERFGNDGNSKRSFQCKKLGTGKDFCVSSRNFDIANYCEVRSTHMKRACVLVAVSHGLKDQMSNIDFLFDF